MRSRRIGWLIAWILSLVAISFYGGAVSYGLFFGISLMPVVAILYLSLVYFRFRIYQEIESRNIVCKQPMPYYFVLHNGEKYAFAGISVRLFSKLSYVEDIPDDRECELLPGEEYVCRTKLVCKYRGEYEVGVKEVVVTDFFRLLRFRYRIPSTIKALVYPRIIRKSELNTLAELTDLPGKELPFGQTHLDAVVRDYVEGDALKQIHWKASARERKLKSRNYIGEERGGVTFFCDTKRYYKDIYQYLPLENQILETLLALGFFWAEKNTPFAVYFPSKNMRMVHVEGMNGFDVFYEEVAHVMFDETEDTKLRLQELLEAGALLDTKLFIGVLHEISDSLLAMLEEVASTGVTVMLYVITGVDMEGYMRRGSERLKVIPIPIEAELEEVL